MLKKKNKMSLGKKLLLGLVCLIIVSLIFAPDVDKDSYSKHKIPFNTDSLNTWFIDKSIPYDRFNDWGSPETLEGTNNFLWVAYIDSIDVAFVSSKKTNKIIFADEGKRGVRKYLKKRAKQIEKATLNGHTALKTVAKSQMNDPKSFDLLDRFVYDRGEYIEITLKFTRSNAFGATERGQITGKVDMEGNIIEVVHFE